MQKGHFIVVAALLTLGAHPSLSADTLTQWAADFSRPDIQRKILQRIFPEVDSSASELLDKSEGTYLFSKGGSWVQLKKTTLLIAPRSPNGQGTLIVTCLLRRTPDQNPLSASSYSLPNTYDHATLLTGGYATNENIKNVDLPNLKKSFLLISDLFKQGPNASSRWSISLVDSNPESIRAGHPRNVWSSPMSGRPFQIGFAALRPNAPEDLVMRSVSPPKGTAGDYSTDLGETYKAYTWTGDRFEPDEMIFESRLKQLPESVWQYGTGK